MNQYPASIVRNIVRLWPFRNGQGRLIDAIIRYTRFPTGVVTCRTTDGSEMHVNGGDLIGRHILLSGQFDQSGVRQLARFGGDGDVILDVGANIGYVSTVLLGIIPNSTAIAVEPNPEVFELLRLNMLQFGDRAKTMPVALSDRDGLSILNLNSTNAGASSLERKQQSGVEVAVRSTEAFLKSMDRLDLVKIDVEGHEETILRSGAAELARLKPKAILYEDQEKKSGPDGAISRLLGEIGYAVYGVRKTLNSTTLVKVRSDADCRFNDYLALRESAQKSLSE